MRWEPDLALHDARVRAADEVAAWAASGAMALTGRAGGPALGPPAGLVTEVGALGARLEERTVALGTPVRIDPLALLGERAALAGLSRHGATSCGGATRLLRARDGWVAVSLARAADVELVPAWLEHEPPVDDVWDAVTRSVASSEAEAVVDRGVLLGLPVAVLPQVPRDGALPVRAVAVPGPPPPASELRDLVAVDLGALWAGPLCGSLLASAGVQVIKVESSRRPDGARLGPPALFDLLNAGKRSVALDLRDREGVRALHALLAQADIVIEASRPRALEQLGVDPSRLLAGGGPRVWASITGHGRTGPGRDRVAFGDDAAVAGGLVCWDEQGPCLCADAVADPLSGMVAALAVLDGVASGRRLLLDVAMSSVAAHLAGPTLPAGAVAVAPPRARAPIGRAAALGEHTAAVLGELLVR